MTKIVLDSNVTNIDSALMPYNNNFLKIETELQDKVLYRDNPSGEPNAMKSPLDMNGQRVYNVPIPTSPLEAVNKQYVDDYVDIRVDEFIAILQPLADQTTAAAASASDSAVQASSSANLAIQKAAAAENSAQSAKTYSDSSQFSANSAASSATEASKYSALGLGGAAGFDFGSVGDAFIAFPTDFGSIV